MANYNNYWRNYVDNQRYKINIAQEFLWDLPLSEFSVSQRETYWNIQSEIDEHAEFWKSRMDTLDKCRCTNCPNMMDTEWQRIGMTTAYSEDEYIDVENCCLGYSDVGYHGMLSEYACRGKHHPMSKPTNEDEKHIIHAKTDAYLNQLRSKLGIELVCEKEKEVSYW